LYAVGSCIWLPVCPACKGWLTCLLGWESCVLVYLYSVPGELYGCVALVAQSCEGVYLLWCIAWVCVPGCWGVIWLWAESVQVCLYT
jgi:hypothetical protein